MSAEATAIDGVWDITVQVPGKAQQSVVTLKSDGETVTGTMDSEEYGVQEIEDGKWDGETLVWKSKTTKPMKLTLTYTATLDENNNLEGQVKVAMAKFKISGVPRQLDSPNEPTKKPVSFETGFFILNINSRAAL